MWGNESSVDHINERNLRKVSEKLSGKKEMWHTGCKFLKVSAQALALKKIKQKLKH